MARLKRVSSVFEQVEAGEEFIFLGSIADLVETEVPAGEWEVVLNGKILTKDLWEVTYPGDADIVLLQPLVYDGGGSQDEKQRSMLLIGVSIASMGVGAALGTTAMAGTLGITAGGMAQSSIVIAGMTATNIIGGMLVNKLIPYPETKDKPNSSVYGLNPLATQQQGLALPMWYGEFKLKTGNVIAANKSLAVVTTAVVAESYDFILSYGLGPWQSIDDVYIPGALNASKVEKDDRLGLINQRDFSKAFNYSIHTHTVALTPFTSHTTADGPIDPDTTITFEIESTAIDKFDFSVLWPNGCYFYDKVGGKGHVEITLTTYVADSASYTGSDYAWSPVVIEGGSVYTQGGTVERTRASGRWSLGSWISTKILDYGIDYGNTAGNAIWLEFGQNLVNISADVPDADTSLLTDHTWRYINTTEVIKLVTPYTRIVSRLLLKDLSVFTTTYAAQINALHPVTGYVFKLAFTRQVYEQNDTFHYNGALGYDYKGMVCDSSITIFNTYTDPVATARLSYPRNVLVHINGTAEKNVQSFLPEVSFHGRRVWVWNGTTWNFIYSNNPAWVCHDVLTQPVVLDAYWKSVAVPTPTVTPETYVARYEGINPSQVDHVSFKAWADFCDAQVANPNGGTETRYTFNGGFDDINSLWEAALAICAMSQAWLVWHGNEIQVVLDDTTAVSQLFTSGDYIVDSVKESYLSLVDRATAIEVEYIDKGKNYESNKFSLAESGYADAQKKVALQLRGCTSNSQAYRSAKIELLKNKHLKKTVEFQAPLKAITCTVGDVVDFQSSVGKGNWGGRLKEIVSTQVVILDREYTFDGAKTYTLKVMRESGSIVTTNLVTLSGTTDVITLNSEITVAAMETYALGESTLVTESLRVLDISQTTELLCTLSCVQYVPEIYDYNDSDIANIIYTPVADMPVVTINDIATFAYFDTVKKHRSFIGINITKPDSIYYSSAKVYYKLTAEDTEQWKFVGVLSGTSFQFEVPEYSTDYTVAVVTVNTQDITMNLLDAPTDNIVSGIATLEACSSLSATPQYLATLATWGHQNNDSIASYELWMASSNDRTVASQVYEGVENNAIIQIRHDLNYYLWVRPVDSLGNTGAWFPTSSAAGILATSTVLQLDQIDEYNQTAPNPTSVSQPTFS